MTPMLGAGLLVFIVMGSGIAIGLYGLWLKKQGRFDDTEECKNRKRTNVCRVSVCPRCRNSWRAERARKKAARKNGKPAVATS